MTDKTANARKVYTAPFRMSFPSLLEVRTNDEGKKRYELSMLLPPGADLGPYKLAMKAAMVDKFGDDPAKWPKLKRGPGDVLKDFGTFNAAAEKPLPGDWTGWTLVRCGSPENKPPGVVGPVRGADNKFPRITDKREVYGGRWARATVEAYYYDKNGKGVTFGLINVQLLKHDQTFGRAVSNPDSEFDDAPEEFRGDDDWGKQPDAAPKAGDDAEGWD